MGWAYNIYRYFIFYFWIWARRAPNLSWARNRPCIYVWLWWHDSILTIDPNFHINKKQNQQPKKEKKHRFARGRHEFLNTWLNPTFSKQVASLWKGFFFPLFLLFLKCQDINLVSPTLYCISNWLMSCWGIGLACYNLVVCIINMKQTKLVATKSHLQCLIACWPTTLRMT